MPKLRLLTDQNFPSPVFDFSTVDNTVSVVSVFTFDRSLTKRGTPDWLIYLRAHEAGFDAVVTRDASQLDDAEELTVLCDTGMNLITWQTAIEDAVQEWGQLLAYMPLIRNRLEDAQGLTITLPKPSLHKGRNVRFARSRLYDWAISRGTSFPEARSAARRQMKAELNQEGLGSLIRFLG